MTDHDELMDAIQRARPDDLVSARTPAAQALLEEILSMQVARTPEAGNIRPGAPRRLRRGLSGDDSSVTVNQTLGDQIRRSACGADCNVEDPIYRYVDGELYNYFYNDDPARRDGTYRWFRLTGEAADRLPTAGFPLDPSTLLDKLQPVGGFVEVATEEIDGIETTRLRASDPQQTPIPSIDVGIIGDTITSLEVWVDHDDLVRRLDLATTRRPNPGEAVLRAASLSIRFFDLGEPITIEAPTDFEDISLDPTS